MIIWINGPFGAGKTQTAYELHRRLPDSFLYDPEEAGFFIRKNVPSSMKQGDFQDYPMWRETNYLMLKYMADHYQGPIVVPMTVVKPNYFAEIVGRLREDGIVVHHFALLATKETILKRLKSRGDGKNSWAAHQIDRCLKGLTDPIFKHQLDTNQMTIDDVVHKIASMLDLQLLPDNRGPVKKKIDRVITQVKQIRLFK